MPVMGSFLKGMQREDHHYLQIFLPTGAVLFLLAALMAGIRHNLSRGGTFMSMGLGMMLYGLADVKLRDSRWRGPVLLLAFALWMGGSLWGLFTPFTR